MTRFMLTPGGMMPTEPGRQRAPPAGGATEVEVTTDPVVRIHMEDLHKGVARPNVGSCVLVWSKKRMRHSFVYDQGCIGS